MSKMKRKGIPPWFYLFIPLPAAIPLMAVKAGVDFISLPFLGRLQLGIVYPIVLVPIALLCCANATNFLAGFNGLEAGIGLILHVSIGIFALLNERYAAAALALIFAAALLSFLKYNWYPAKVFPGI